MTFTKCLGGQLLRETESPESYMNPTHEESLESLPAEKLSHLLQNRAHYGLASYLNGATEVNLTQLDAVAGRLDLSHSGAGSRERLAETYCWLDSELETGKETKQIRIDRFTRSAYTENDLETTINTIATQLDSIEDILTSAILHGSFGDLTYVRNYSDVDLLLIIPWTAITDINTAERLRDTIFRIQREMYYVDPHQHHGVMVVTDLDLRAYNQAYIPPAALTRGTVLCGEQNISFSIRDDKLERKYGFWRNVQRLRKTVDENQFPVSFDEVDGLDPGLSGHLHNLKYFTSFIMLQPSMYLLADGRPIYKAESFDEVSGLQEIGEIVTQCSEIRQLYPKHVTFNRGENYRQQLQQDPMEARRNQQSNIPKQFQNILDGRVFHRSLEFIEHLWTRVN